ncbi:hypothetical protein HMPREF0080_01975 [Anaeroglobus geminatus F0357]|uniref:Uncharacterized protein n=1 Tax=Anaeroglobus geminatus F0357 TaxID=861450 RepID=G9YJW9_9FIRM|nr:hypothetical protein HMPREF0080_01975 [Anaeroglobus geminatus F0357]
MPWRLWKLAKSGSYAETPIRKRSPHYSCFRFLFLFSGANIWIYSIVTCISCQNRRFIVECTHIKSNI